LSWPKKQIRFCCSCWSLSFPSYRDPHGLQIAPDLHKSSIRSPYLHELYRIAHNTIVDHYRTCREPDCRLEDVELVDTNNVPEENLISQERQELQKVSCMRNGTCG
jgi:hypothetical protein